MKNRKADCRGGLEGGYSSSVMKELTGVLYRF